MSVGPDYKRPDMQMQARFSEIKGWKISEPQGTGDVHPWWEMFGDRHLNALVASVATSNFSVAAAEAYYQEALAILKQTGSALFPMAAANGQIAAVASNFGSPTPLQEAGASVGWTLDLWGKTRREVEASEAAVRESAARIKALTLSAQAAVASAYLQIRTVDAQVELLNRSIKDYERALEIVQQQYAEGTSTKLDVLSEQAQILDARSRLTSLAILRGQSEHAVAALTGRMVAEFAIAPGPFPTVLPKVPPTLPSSLLERRPDIVIAEEAMHAANARIGVAMTGYFPDLTLSGATRSSGTIANRVLYETNPVWTLGLSMSKVLFDGGRTDAEVEAAKSAYLASVASYRGAVVGAIREVEDQLTVIRTLDNQQKLSEKQVQITRQSLKIAFNEYRVGTQSFSTVIAAQQIELAAENAAIERQSQFYGAVINLAVGLGGGWKRDDALPHASAATASP